MRKHLQTKGMHISNWSDNKHKLMYVTKSRDKNKIKEAVLIQDKLRKKSKNWNGAEEIRKLRESK